jgi:hypothetical protein
MKRTLSQQEKSIFESLARQVNNLNRDNKLINEKSLKFLISEISERDLAKFEVSLENLRDLVEEFESVIRVAKESIVPKLRKYLDSNSIDFLFNSFESDMRDVSYAISTAKNSSVKAVTLNLKILKLHNVLEAMVGTALGLSSRLSRFNFGNESLALYDSLDKEDVDKNVNIITKMFVKSLRGYNDGIKSVTKNFISKIADKTSMQKLKSTDDMMHIGDDMIGKIANELASLMYLVPTGKFKEMTSKLTNLENKIKNVEEEVTERGVNIINNAPTQSSSETPTSLGKSSGSENRNTPDTSNPAPSLSSKSDGKNAYAKSDLAAKIIDNYKKRLQSKANLGSTKTKASIKLDDIIDDSLNVVQRKTVRSGARSKLKSNINTALQNAGINNVIFESNFINKELERLNLLVGNDDY